MGRGNMNDFDQGTHDMVCKVSGIEWEAEGMRRVRKGVIEMSLGVEQASEMSFVVLMEISLAKDEHAFR